MDVIQRIDALMEDRSWSDYRLAAESGLSQSTIANIHRRHTLPSIPTLEAICGAFGITLAQFFSDDLVTVQLSSDQKEFFEKSLTLSDKQKKIINDVVYEMKH